MRPSIIRLISSREIRDLLRDRRTVMLILVLPVVMWVLVGAAGTLIAQSLLEQTSRIGIEGLANLPETGPRLIVDGALSEEFLKSEKTEGLTKLEIVLLDGDPDDALKSKQVDVVLVVPPGFAASLTKEEQPTLTVLDRDGDEKSKLAGTRLLDVLRAWQRKLREAKFARRGLPTDFDRVFVLKDPESRKPKDKRTADELRDLFVKGFPFILMMWLVAGAIQPAVDLTAGEKERGTMETLLISPAERSEIVFGKFFAVFAFTFASVIWNVCWLTGAAVAGEWVLGFPILNFSGLIGCLAVGVPLAMFFSAVSVALGIFARSTKEGQYYLLPMILITMPLAMTSMLPGVELTTGRALTPVTGAMLMQQKFLRVGESVPWHMLLPVLGGLFLSIAIALWLAVRQFHRESVIFRETGSQKQHSRFARFRKSA